MAMDMAARIRAKLGAALAPQHLEVIDQSAQHAGHAGARPGGETHFRVEIVAAAFEGKPPVARQRRVYEILKDELAAGVHALSLSTLTPAEAKEPHTPV
jgi:BolA family transcriptional regulator, general stress-responsive regulator